MDMIGFKLNLFPHVPHYGIISHRENARARSSAAEQAAHNRSVVGSNPTGPT